MPIIGSCEAIAASVPSKLENQRPPAQSPLFRWKKSMTEADMGASRCTSGDEWYSTQRRPWSRRSRPRLSKLRKVTCGARCPKMAHGGMVACIESRVWAVFVLPAMAHHGSSLRGLAHRVLVPRSKDKTSNNPKKKKKMGSVATCFITHVSII